MLEQRTGVPTSQQSIFFLDVQSSISSRNLSTNTNGGTFGALVSSNVSEVPLIDGHFYPPLLLRGDPDPALVVQLEDDRRVEYLRSVLVAPHRKTTGRSRLAPLQTLPGVCLLPSWAMDAMNLKDGAVVCIKPRLAAAASVHQQKSAGGAEASAASAIGELKNSTSATAVVWEFRGSSGGGKGDGDDDDSLIAALRPIFATAGGVHYVMSKLLAMSGVHTVTAKCGVLLKYRGVVGKVVPVEIWDGERSLLSAGMLDEHTSHSARFLTTTAASLSTADEFLVRRERAAAGTDTVHPAALMGQTQRCALHRSRGRTVN